ncbi:MAG: hypothetical protein ABFC89_10720 [Methanospirillum sp.]
MAKERLFIDPAFTCEVMLSGTALRLYEAVGYDFERLNQLKSLGLTSHISDFAFHHRHQHLIGLMRIFNKLCQQPKRKGLPKEFLWSFWCRLCYGQTGHAALSYDSEKAVLLACQVSPSFKEQFMQFLSPVTDKLATCEVCGKKCTAKDADRTTGMLWLEELVTKNHWYKIHFWVAALKLIRNGDVLRILNGQNTGDNSLKFSEVEAFKILTAPKCMWQPAMERLSLLDFVVRDLAYAGTLGIRVDIDGLVAAADSDHKDWGLIYNLARYLQNNLYEKEQGQVISVLYQRLLADLLINGRITLDALFGMGQNPLDDPGLIKIIKKTQVGKDIDDASLRSAWQTWVIKIPHKDGQLPFEIEAAINGNEMGDFTGTKRTLVTCICLHQNNSIGLALCHKDLDTRPPAQAYVRLIERLSRIHGPRLQQNQIEKALCQGLINRKCENDLQGAIAHLAAFEYPLNLLREVADIFKDAWESASSVDMDLALRIGSREIPFRNDPDIFEIYLIIEYLRMADSDRPTRLGLTRLGVAVLIWQRLLNYQGLFFSHRPKRQIIALLDCAQAFLAREVVNGGPQAARDLELYSLLEALKHPRNAISFRMALPNVKIIGEDQNIQNEYDILSVVLKNRRKVEVWLWGVTTEENIGRKRLDDRRKMGILRDTLGERWRGDIKTVENYIHTNGSDILCDIDGIQTRRRIN